ncbi:spore coat protein [Clostridium sp. 'White wine YQ']|uniref:spore coat protein n=1 Tax=Clostridium sp. 'White wine YQ' TaxID=3027474 RepID=UPI002365F854|nr:spore coat protein [Clostridium sp. 'White wine YQ']MDD7796074.1 spore coat protein [Clostridium sp. 'White wine YQ']
MITDYLEVRNAEGMPKLIDETMSLTFLLNAKSGVRNCAIALTEATSPSVRSVLKRQLDDALNLHAEISDLMLSKGWFHPVDLEKQFRMDIESSETATQIANLDLFPGNTNRLGNFATPEK